MNEIKLEQKVDVQMIRGRKPENRLGIEGKFYLEHWRDGKCLNKQEI